MQTGDIVFVGGSNAIDKAVRFFDKGKFDHVCMFVNDTQIVEAKYTTGVCITDYKYDNPGYVTEVIHLNLSDEQKAKVMKLAEKYVGEDYDFMDIFIIWLRLEFDIDLEKFYHNDDEQICSELVGHILIGLGLAEKGTEEMTPNEMYRFFKNKGY